MSKRTPPSPRGFTLVETLISLSILSLVLVLSIQIFQKSQRATRNASEKGDLQQSARIAIEIVTGDLRSVGFDLDTGAGQQALVYGDSWDLIFNANILPAQDDPLIPGDPEAIDLAFAPASVPPGGALYIPTATYQTGAETIRYTLDSDGDGAVTGADATDDRQEGTANPNDFVLRKEIYGARADGTNGGVSEGLGLVRGPLPDPNGTLPIPLFTYWLDHDDDATTGETLHGDTDADGALSQAEIAALGPVPAANLALITRVVITLTTEDASTEGRPDYRSRSMISSVSFRNHVRRTGIIVGTVFQDSDGDQMYDPTTEPPIPAVTVRLNTGNTAETTTMGQYVFEVTPGTYTVTEFDPPGYVSTTPNVLSYTITTGQTVIANFGDRPGSGVGVIEGTVYEDANMNATLDAGEPGLEGIVVSLHTGVADTTDTNGFYSFDVPVGTYTVVEIDSTGWASTTPNAVEVTLSIDGQTETVDFGDVRALGFGTLQGLVYLDADHDGLYTGSEAGIPDVPITIWQGSPVDSAVTNGSGVFTVSLPPGTYDVFEWDADGYTSTSPNLVKDIQVMTDSTTYVYFGDILNSTVSFTVVTVGQTDRALSIETMDLVEDNKGDSDIVLGTQLSAASNNLHVWHNERRNSGTPITALFSATPTFSRNAGDPIPVMLEMRANNDGVPDVVTGLETGTVPNVQFWVTQTSAGNKGKLPTTPTSSFATNLSSTVLSLAETVWPTYGAEGLLVGTVDATGSGHVEVWGKTGPAAYTHLSSSDLHFDSYGGLGEISGLVVADFNADFHPDIAVAQDLGGYTGRVTIFEAGDGNGDFTLPWTYTEAALFWTEGSPGSIKAIDMREDDLGDVDLVLGTSRAANSGVIELWLNDVSNGHATFGATGSRDDWIDAGGEVLSLGLTRLDADTFPDVIAGLRTNQYAGAVSVFRGFGYLPSSGTEWSHTGSGEVVTLTVDDFNIDGLKDIAVGTRTAATSGELVVYFGE